MLKPIKYVYLILLFVFVQSCSNSYNSPKRSPNSGGTFTFALSDEPATLLARNVLDMYSSTVLSQIYQGLVALDPVTLEIEPALAESWEISDDGKTIRFTLRDDIYFHNHSEFPESIKLSAEDVKFSVELACTPYEGKETYAYSSIYKGILKGARAFFDGEKDHIDGLTIQDNIIEFELLERDVNFLNKLTQVTAIVLSKQIVEAGYETDLIGTGPFKFSGYFTDEDDRDLLVLVKNEKYYETDEEGYQLPYLDSLIVKIESKSLRQLEMFENEEILLLEGLPPSRISMMLGEGKIEEFNSTPPKLLLIRKPLLATEYYHFNLLKKEFQDVRVRQAINYAINRDVIINDILNNQAYGIGDAGLVPPAAFNGYNSEEVKKHSYSYNPKKARQLLANAGYPDGKGFPSLNLKFNLGSTHSAVADEISKQLKKELNINVNIDGMPFQNKLKDQENANGDIFRTSWYADYYNPENFLMNGYGKVVPEDSSTPSLTNHSRYKNKAFDEAFDKAKSTTDIVNQYKYFAEAESILMKDAPYIILWYEETIKIAYSKVRNLHLNEMNYYSFKDVYIKEWTKDEWEERSKL